jgi:uncharacterized protein YjbI with pentapeptide repeats
MRLSPPIDQVMTPFERFVYPRYNRGAADDYNLPLHDFFVEQCLEENNCRQLLISGARGSGLSASLQWLELWLLEFTKQSSDKPVLVHVEDLLGPEFEKYLDLLESDRGILFVDLSITPHNSIRRAAFQSLLQNGINGDIQSRSMLWSSRVVVACHNDDALLQDFEAIFELERLYLAPWEADEWIELLGSTASLKSQRSQIFGGLQQLLGKHSQLSRPRSACWLLDSALKLPDKKSMSLADLYANILDTLSPELLSFLRELDGDRVSIDRLESALCDKRLSLEDVSCHFELSPMAAQNLQLKLGHFSMNNCAATLPALEPQEHFTSLVLRELGDFFRAGLQLQDIAQDQVPWPINPRTFKFMKEMITDKNRKILREWLLKTDIDECRQSVAASFLWACEETPKVDGSHRLYRFVSAYLDEVDWPGVNLSDAHFHSTDLNRAKLQGSVLMRCRFTGVSAAGAKFDGANLNASKMTICDMFGASFLGASLANAELSDTNIEGARFIGSTLEGTTIEHCRVAGSHFHRCVLRRAKLINLALNKAEVTDCSWASCSLLHCDLSGMNLSEIEAASSDFANCDLSDTSFASGHFALAKFRDCRANEVNFQDANLSGSVFEEVSFHAGSSRSGLLLNKPALEGNMTHYYTENHKDDVWGRPESIRHANFNGANLIGARFINTNLFRVDFRGAKLDPGLRRMARKHEAILDD